MTSQPPSRTPLSLADVLRAVALQPDLTAHRRRDLASAVRRVAQLIGRDPGLIEAVPRLLARRLAEISPAAHHLSRGRWNNIRALLGAALKLVQPISPGRHLTSLTPEWQALRDRITMQRMQRSLSRFLHFCSAEGIAPGAVDDAVLQPFAAYLQNSLLKSPAEVLRLTRHAWTLACQQVPGWPDRPFPVVPRTDWYALPWSHFPASLQTDVQSWLDRLAGRDPLEEMPFRAVRPGTLVAREGQLRRFASALVHRGRDPASLRNLADLVEIDTFKEGLRFFLERRGGTSSAIADLAATLKAVARHWVGVDAAHLVRMTAVMRRLEVPRRGLTETNRQRLRPLDDPETRLALLLLPQRLVRLAEQTRQPCRAALLVQMALAVELLLMAPVRGSNLAAIDLERHLVRPGRSRTMVHLIVAPQEVKNDECLEFPLPPETTALLERYRTEFRPALAPAGSTALFPGRGGQPKGRPTLARQISATVFRYTGIRVHTHLFRHIGAKLYLDANPGGYEVMRRVLGHRSIETTTSFYTGLETAATVRHFDDTILRLRRKVAA